MRVRSVVRQTKHISSETGWSESDLPPRFAPIYSKSLPMRAGWKWRSARLTAHEQHFILWVQCNPKRDNWKAVLAQERNGEAFVICRFEYHGSHPGLHIHSDCARSGLEKGAAGMNIGGRVPDTGRYHRRSVPWTESTFWEATKMFFRVKVENGPLFDA